MGKKYTITLLRPAGNDTALVQGLVDAEEKKIINKIIMQRFPTIEQVGFYDLKNKVLEMAGGEFCGNATRSFAFLLLKNKLGNTTVKVIGIDTPLEVGIHEYGTAYAQIPIVQNMSCIKKQTTNITQVVMQGITHLIIEKMTGSTSPQEIKEFGKQYLSQYNLLSTVPSAGALFMQRKQDKIIMNPVIWVRDIKTLFYETSCASGSTAIALAESLKSGSANAEFSVLQPSGMQLNVTISKTPNLFISAFIDGPIELLGKEIITI